MQLTLSPPDFPSQAQFQASLSKRGGSPSSAVRPGSGATLEALFTKAAADKVYAGKRGRVPRPVVKSLLGRFAQSSDDQSAVTAILAALPAAADNLVGFRELTAAVKKVAVRPPSVFPPSTWPGV